MSRALVIINTDRDRLKALTLLEKVPNGTRVEFRESKRSLSQNALLWQLLTEIATQVVWYGERLTAGDWKDMFTASLRKARVVHGIDPGTRVVLGLHTSDMTKDELSNLIELIYAFGAEQGVVFQDTVPHGAEHPAGRPASSDKGVPSGAGQDSHGRVA